jgi:hypothetical protein
MFRFASWNKKPLEKQTKGIQIPYKNILLGLKKKIKHIFHHNYGRKYNKHVVTNANITKKNNNKSFFFSCYNIFLSFSLIIIWKVILIDVNNRFVTKKEKTRRVEINSKRTSARKVVTTFWIRSQ